MLTWAMAFAAVMRVEVPGLLVLAAIGGDVVIAVLAERIGQ
jgi:hypothetical protein